MAGRYRVRELAALPVLAQVPVPARVLVLAPVRVRVSVPASVLAMAMAQVGAWEAEYRGQSAAVPALRAAVTVAVPVVALAQNPVAPVGATQARHRW